MSKVKEILVDCDLDCVAFKIEQVGGAACHEGYRAASSVALEADGNLTVVGERVFDPSEVYKK